MDFETEMYIFGIFVLRLIQLARKIFPPAFTTSFDTRPQTAERETFQANSRVLRSIINSSLCLLSLFWERNWQWTPGRNFQVRKNLFHSVNKESASLYTVQANEVVNRGVKIGVKFVSISFGYINLNRNLRLIRILWMFLLVAVLL